MSNILNYWIVSTFLFPELCPRPVHSVGTVAAGQLVNVGPVAGPHRELDRGGAGGGEGGGLVQLHQPQRGVRQPAGSCALGLRFRGPENLIFYILLYY